MNPFRIFIGYDPRQPIAYQVLHHSIIARASRPVSITPLVLSQLPIKRRGLTEFTFSRYLVPYLCHYEGHALFMDADMLCLDDINELERFIVNEKAVHVVQEIERFERPSLMLFDNEKCRALTPEFIETGSPQKLEWGTVGSLPKEWNHIIPYSGTNPDAKIVHYTQGIPFFKETINCEYSKEWFDEANRSMSTVTWNELMGTSVHKQRMGL